MAREAAAAPSGGTPIALVTADEESHVVSVDVTTGRIMGRIETPPGPRSIESVFVTSAIVAHTVRGVLSIIDGPTLSVRSVVDGFREPRYTAVHPDRVTNAQAGGGRALAYVTDSKALELVTLDVAAGRVLARTSIPGPARHVTVSSDGGKAWTALGSKAEHIAVLDLENPRRPRLERLVRPPFRAHDVVFDPEGTHVWVTGGEGQSLAVYEKEGRKPVAIIAAGAPPQHVTFRDTFRGTQAYVASGDAGTLRTFSRDGTLRHEARVPVGSYNVTETPSGVMTPSLERGTLTLLDAKGRVRRVRRVARAAHDVCLVVAV